MTLARQGCVVVDEIIVGYGTRSKRQAQAVDVHTDENSDPEQEMASVDSPSFGAEKKLASISIATPKRPKAVARTAKHSISSTRVQSPSNTINAHFSISKASVERAAKKQDLTLSPHTPRHRDALSKKVVITPKTRVQLVGTPRTPHTPRTPSDTPGNPYNKARQLFSNSGNTCGLIGRDDEKREVSDFISRRLESADGGCLYVSGPPGTGKSALLGEVLEVF